MRYGYIRVHGIRLNAKTNMRPFTKIEGKYDIAAGIGGSYGVIQLYFDKALQHLVHVDGNAVQGNAWFKKKALPVRSCLSFP